ncbi:uncharacterized protein LOC126199476 [Schistocerca nitens]|uniref:uncharacterized protein LOC126199476 n=1 Tax=Schistocerca nitens TaxID=7011 RepID=UPI00211974C4|nr:uncharacterized protein LOC126199476 [Schistocerca nitens]
MERGGGVHTSVIDIGVIETASSLTIIHHQAESKYAQLAQDDQGDCRVSGFGPRRVPAAPSDFAAAIGQQQQPSPIPRRQPVPLMPPAQLHPGAPQVVAPAPAVPLQSPPPSELMDVDPSAGPPSQALAVQPVLQPLSLGTPKKSDTAAPCPAPTRQPSTQRQETLPLFVGPDAPSRPVAEAAPVVTGVHPDLGFQSVFPEAPRSQCWGADRGLPPTAVSAPNTVDGKEFDAAGKSKPDEDNGDNDAKGIKIIQKRNNVQMRMMIQYL